jgi:adenylate cyclase
MRDRDEIIVADSQNSARQRWSAFWQTHQSKIKGILMGASLSAGIGFLLLWTALGDTLRNRSYDLPFQFLPEKHPTEVVLIYLDDASHAYLKQKYLEPWSRAFFTRLLKRLTADKAKAVVFDIVFSDLLDSKIDQEFAEAIRENGNVILAADWVAENYGAQGAVAESHLEKPADLFNSNAADLGSDAFKPDEDLNVRRYMPEIAGAGAASEAWAAARLINAPITKDTNAQFKPFWLNYYGPELYLKSVAFYKALKPNDRDVPPGYFKNKVVFVGEKLFTKGAGARKDEYPSPFSYVLGAKYYSGVSIHATAYLNLVRGDWLNQAPTWLQRSVILLLGILFGTGLVLCRPVLATLLALLATLPIAIANYYLVKDYYYWFPWLIPVVGQIPVALIWSIAFNSVRLYVEKEKVEQSLSLYLSPKLVKKFSSDPKLLKPGAEKQLLTILFSDIAGFTSISEGMDSDDLAKLMNQYFQTAVHNCIHSTDGTVVKYIGDAIFAFWNAPDPQGDHPFRACEAALLFRDQAKHSVNGRELVTRIGLHTGVANVGNFGSESRVDYTAIGENINLASRMEGLNKYLGTIVLLTGDTKEGIGERLVTRYLGLFRLKGFEKAVAVHELVDRAHAEAKSRELRQRFAEALTLLSKKDFDGADAAFHHVLKISPEDGPSKFYLEQIEELRSNGLPPDWKGEIILKDK